MSTGSTQGFLSETIKIITHISVIILQTLTCCYQYCLELSKKTFQTQKLICMCIFIFMKVSFGTSTIK